MFEVLRQNSDVRRLVAGWWLLALSALAISTFCAVLLVLARTSLLDYFTADHFSASHALFREALVMHVNLAVVVWFLASAAGLWSLLSCGVCRLRWLALLLSASGAVAMVVAPFLASSTPVLANYVPVLDNRVFLVGLACFVAGVALCGMMVLASSLYRLKLSALAAWHCGLLLSILAALVALGALLISLLAVDLPAGLDRFEMIAWAPGHLLQFVHMLLLMTAWMVLGERVFGVAVASQRWLVGLLVLAAAPVLVAPLIFVLQPVGSQAFRHAFTLLMACGVWPAATLFAVLLLVKLARAGRAVWTVVESVPLLLSLLLFVFGCLLGSMIRGESTMVPAHYHGTVGAVTLAYMALGYRLLPAFSLGVAAGRLVRWQPVIYGTGLLTLASALAWSGWLGMPRKTLPVELAAQSVAYLAAMGLTGLGGLLAIGGAALFVFNIVRSLWCGCSKAVGRDIACNAQKVSGCG